MAIYALGDYTPQIHPEAYVHPDATVIGDVRIGAFSSVWPQAVLRGDYGRIVVDERTSIQDGTVIHCTEVHPVHIGSSCVIGHNVHIEGATVADECLIASGSVVLNGSIVEKGAIVGVEARWSRSTATSANARWCWEFPPANVPDTLCQNRPGHSSSRNTFRTSLCTGRSSVGSIE